MRRLIAAVGLLAWLCVGAAAQPTGTNTVGSSSLVIGTTTITGGATTQVLFNLAGVVSSDSGFTYAGSNGQVTLGGGMFVTGNVTIAQNQLFATTGRGGIQGPADGAIKILNNAGSSTATLTVSGGNPGLLTLNSQMAVTLGTDSGQTATSTVCMDTTSHQFYFGSGTGGICKGTSSERFKDGIAPLTAGLNEILKLSAVSYTMKQEYGDPSRILYGFTAEQMYSVLPDLVWLDKDGRPSSVDYLGVTIVMARAIQQLTARVDALEHRPL